MVTQKDELVGKTRAKIIELFGPESALAQAVESDDFFDKLGDLVSWLFGEIMLSQPRPPARPWPKPPEYPERPQWKRNYYGRETTDWQQTKASTTSG